MGTRRDGRSVVKRLDPINALWVIDFEIVLGRSLLPAERETAALRVEISPPFRAGNAWSQQRPLPPMVCRSLLTKPLQRHRYRISSIAELAGRQKALVSCGKSPCAEALSR